MPRLRQLTVAAVFDAGHYEYDASLLLMNIDDAAKLFRVQGVTGLRLKTSDMLAAPQIARVIGSIILLLMFWYLRLYGNPAIKAGPARAVAKDDLLAWMPAFAAWLRAAWSRPGTWPGF